MRCIVCYIILLFSICFNTSFAQVKIESTEFFFNSNDTLLTQYSQRKLEKFIVSATEIPLYITRIRVFSDTIGPFEYNRVLSEKRANAIKRQLGNLADQSYTEIAIYGKHYDSIKYPLGDLQMWRRLEVSYQYEKPPVLEGIEIDEENQDNNVDTLVVEIDVADIVTEYEKKVKLYTFDTLDVEAVNRVIQLNIQFIQNSDHLYGSSYSEIKSLADFMNKYPELNVLIRGHVCCGNNMKMSKKRAKKVYKSLIEAGISKKRLKFKGYSNKEPVVYPELTEKDRQSNRRVDVIFSVK